MVKDQNPISCIHVTLVRGHEFPINCGSQHGWKNSSRFQAGLEPGTLCFSILVLEKSEKIERIEKIKRIEKIEKIKKIEKIEKIERIKKDKKR